MCSSVLGTMTQSWWPPLLGQMPTSSSVSASMKAMPLDSRWKAAEHADHVFAIIRHRQRLHVGPDALDLLLDLPGLGVDHHHAAGGWRRMQDRKIELGPVHGEHHVERVGVFADPQGILDMRDLLPVARVGIARIEDGAIVLAQIVHHAEKAPVGGEPDLVAGRE